MSQALILEPFLTAITCLCASSYEPNLIPPINLKKNFENAILNWNENILETLAMAGKEFQLNNRKTGCTFPDFYGIRKRSPHQEKGERLLCDCEMDQQKIDTCNKNLNKLNFDLQKESQFCLSIMQMQEELQLQSNNTINELTEQLKFTSKQLKELDVQFTDYKRKDEEIKLKSTEKTKNLTNQLNLNRLDIDEKAKEIIQLKLQHQNDQNELEKLRAENKNFQDQLKILHIQNDGFNSQIKKLKLMAPPNIRSLKNNCLMATESGVANLELRIKEDLYCAHDVDAKFGEGWILVAQRFDGSVDFNRSWIDYVQGFGAYGQQHEFFAGLERLYALTQNSSQELLFILTDNKHETRYAHYDDFAIANEKQGYMLKSLGHFSGDAGDSLTEHLNQKFATFDKVDEAQCAKIHSNGWWYIPKTCLKSNLFGPFLPKKSENDVFQSKGIIWSTFHNIDDQNGLVSMRMYVRPIEIQFHIRIH